MKSMNKLAFGAAALLLVVAGFQPAQASCPAGASPIVDFAGAYIVSNPNWCGIGGAGVGFGCYDDQGGAPISPAFDGFFWAQTAANEAFLAGADNGTFAVRQWVKQGDGTGFPRGDYHYPAFLSVNDGDANGWSAAGGPFDWSSGGIDGCISSVTPTVNFDECHCALLTDEWGGQGYYALFSKLADPIGNFIFQQQGGAVYNLASIPRPSITGSTRDAANATVTFNIDVPLPTGADYRDPSCGCDFGFRVYAAVVGEGGMVPSSRRACTQRALVAAGGPNIPYTDPTFISACKAAGFVWVPAEALGGGPQPATSFGAARATAGVTVDCGEPNMAYDLYLATSLGANEGAGVQLGAVSQNSFQVKCGNYQLAEPNRPERPSAPGRSDSPRRDGRGSRDR